MKNHNPKTALNTRLTGENPGPKTLFSARLYAHRSLSRKGFIVLMAFISIICFGLGGFFWSIGAWPIFGFMGLDVLAIYIAFKVNYRDARAFEDVSISRQEMRIEKTSAGGECKVYTFNPVWTRFHVKRHDEIGITSMEILSRKMRLRIGDFLNPHDRESFAREFGAALASAKR